MSARKSIIMVAVIPGCCRRLVCLSAERSSSPESQRQFPTASADTRKSISFR